MSFGQKKGTHSARTHTHTHTPTNGMRALRFRKECFGAVPCCTVLRVEMPKCQLPLKTLRERSTAFGVASGLESK